MEITKVLGIALISLVIVILIKNEKPEISIQISLAAGLIIFLMMISKLTIIVQALQGLASKINLEYVYLNTILKIIGIAYLASFGVEICKDSGQNAIGAKIEFAGKVLIIALAIPILMAVMDMIIKIMP